MRYQLLLCADHGGQSGPGEHAVAPTAEPLAGGAAGTVGLQWLWGLVELHLSQAEPDPAA
ncbi:MAG TPA: hypothetical protein VGI05_01595 [Streptosporangiaceae bacterium]|jgi:hypothetical protein